MGRYHIPRYRIPRYRIPRSILAGAWAVALLLAAPARGDVAIILNRTDRDVPYVGADRVQRYLAAGDLAPLPFEGDGLIEFRSGRESVSRRIQPNRMYLFVAARDGVEMRRLGLSTDVAEEIMPPSEAPPAESSRAAGQAPAGSVGPSAGAASSPAAALRRVVIPVKILVDEDEPATRLLWEPRLRRRIEAASEILKQYCFVELQVVAVDQWNSQNGVTDISQSLAEFEREVSPGPARLAIGFTGQYHATHGRTHLGGTRAMLHSHILMREWSQVASEPERLELLLHELGHFLGAAHSPEPESVMRINMADRKSLARAFRIRFDPLNALAMNMVSEELGRNLNLRPPDLGLPTQFELCKLYAELNKALPNDPAAAQMEDLLEDAGMTPRLACAHWVLRAVAAAAEENARRRPPGTVRPGQPERLAGDALCEYYIARAAEAARRGPPKLAASGFTIGLAFALDRSNTLRKHPLVGPLAERVDPAPSRALRLQTLGEPTALGRADLAQHFFLSAGLTALVGPLAAESCGLWKEKHDSQTSSGFSLVDYQADLAGIALAEALLAQTRSLPDRAKPFVWRDVLPPAGDLPEGLDAAKFAERYGSILDHRFWSERQRIRRRVEQLPAYAGAGPAPNAR